MRVRLRVECWCPSEPDGPFTWGNVLYPLQVHKVYLLWGLKYMNMTYFGLFGAPGYKLPNKLSGPPCEIPIEAVDRVLSWYCESKMGPVCRRCHFHVRGIVMFCISRLICSPLRPLKQISCLLIPCWFFICKTVQGDDSYQPLPWWIWLGPSDLTTDWLTSSASKFCTPSRV